MTVMILGLVVMLGTHLVPAFPAVKDRLVAGFGSSAYRLLFSALSIAGLVLIIWGYGLARETPTVVWYPPLWTRHAASLLMLASFVLLAAAYLPGKIRQKTRHPMLAAVKLWAVAHLLANGTLADIVLFGAVLAWAVFDRISVKRRAQPPPAGGPLRNDVLAVLLGVAAFALVAFWLHEALIGVAPVA